MMAGVGDLKSIVSSSATMARPASLAEEAAAALREMILLETLPAGTALPERDLSGGLGISRTPLREAIRILANEGLVEYSASRRPRVADPTLAEITDYLRVQGALESLSGELACAVASNAELDRIARLNEEMLERNGKDDPVTSFKRDMAFHRSIVAASHNGPLSETHATYNARLWRARFMSSQRRQGRESTRAEHEQIVAALLRRDAEATATSLKNHLATAVGNINLALKGREDYLSKESVK